MTEYSDECASSFWHADLEIGIPVIDEQHRAIAELGDRLVRDPRTALGSETGTSFLQVFYRLLAQHFETEEMLMRRLDIPEVHRQAHFQEHSRLLERVVALSINQIGDNGPKTVADITRDLLHIIVEHVIHADHLIPPMGGNSA